MFDAVAVSVAVTVWPTAMGFADGELADAATEIGGWWGERAAGGTCAISNITKIRKPNGRMRPFMTFAPRDPESPIAGPEALQNSVTALSASATRLENPRKTNAQNQKNSKIISRSLPVLDGATLRIGWYTICSLNSHSRGRRWSYGDKYDANRSGKRLCGSPCGCQARVSGIAGTSPEPLRRLSPLGHQGAYRRPTMRRGDVFGSSAGDVPSGAAWL